MSTTKKDAAQICANPVATRMQERATLLHKFAGELTPDALRNVLLDCLRDEKQLMDYAADLERQSARLALQLYAAQCRSPYD